MDQPALSKKLMKTICKKRKMCVALTMIGEDEEINDKSYANEGMIRMNLKRNSHTRSPGFL